MMKTIHITGVSGFIGSYLKQTLSQNFNVKSSGRLKSPAPKDENYLSIDWSSALANTEGVFNNIDAVIHCAGLAHENKPTSSYQEYFDANVSAATKVFVEAEQAGVRKFLFLSSLSVFDTSAASVTIDDMTKPSPINDYGKTKYIAEQELIKLAEKSDVELTILRIPMVVGASAPGNLERLIQLIKYPIPFPLIAKPAQRSLITVKSLAEFCLLRLERAHCPSATIIRLANTPAITISDLVRGIRSGLNVRDFKILLPAKFLFVATYILGHRPLYNKIYGGLVVEPSSKAIEFGWEPEVNWEAELYEVGLKSKSAKNKND